VTRTVEVTVLPEPRTPTIVYFNVSPNPAVRGSPDANSISLRWLVQGATTNIEITGPDFGKVSNLAPEDGLVYAASKSTVFILTAYNHDKSASQMKSLTLIDPTPTPIPPPIIYFFKAASTDNSNSVVQISDNVYTVVAGSQVALSWEVQNADQISLSDFGNVGPKGTQTTPPITLRNKTYVLTAQNAGGQSSSSIQLNLVSPPPPQPPTNISGQYIKATQPLTITWQYPPQIQSYILGFRMYRGNVPGVGFQAIPALVANSERQWVDTSLPTCGKVYYVVAVYIDPATGQQRESGASTNSWSSPPCPTPTRTP
jgi:hypothetical protein